MFNKFLEQFNQLPNSDKVLLATSLIVLENQQLAMMVAGCVILIFSVKLIKPLL